MATCEASELQPPVEADMNANGTEFSSVGYASVENGRGLRRNDGAVSADTGPESSSLLDNTVQAQAEKQPRELTIWHIVCILSSSFAYGCIMTTLFLITLPVECQRIEKQHPDTPKSVALGSFVAIAGATQLISPLVGMLSDTYIPPQTRQEMGHRLPYLVLGSVFSIVGLLGQYFNSFQQLWLRYGFFFFLHMIGLNITYAMMIALIPDQVPRRQTGVANGILAFLLVTGSLFGFGLFHTVFDSVQDMYGLYMAIVTVSTLLTVAYGNDRDVQLTAERRVRRSFRSGLIASPAVTPVQVARRAVLTPYVLLKTMLYDPLRRLDGRTLYDSYTIDPKQHHDFFIVTVSRLCYYCGMSVQTFFLYFVHDIIHVTNDPESSVAYLAILGQIAGTVTTYPIGLLSDRLGGKRKPFVYVACFLLGAVMVAMIFARTMNGMTVLCLVLGAANGIYLTMETSLAVDTLQDHQSLDNEDGPSGGNAQLLGIWGVAAFLGSALGPMIGGPLLYLIGHSEDSESYSLSGYVTILVLSALYFLGSALSLRWARELE